MLRFTFPRHLWSKAAARINNKWNVLAEVNVENASASFHRAAVGSRFICWDFLLILFISFSFQILTQRSEQHSSFSNHLFYSSYQNQMFTRLLQIRAWYNFQVPQTLQKIRIYKKKKLKPSQRNSNNFQIFTDHGFGNTAKLFALNKHKSFIWDISSSKVT